MNEDDRMSNHTLDELDADCVQIDRRLRPWVHHVDEDVHGDLGRKFGSLRGKPADARVCNPMAVQDAEHLISVEKEKIERSETSGHNFMVPDGSAFGTKAAVGADWEHSPVTTKRSEFGSLADRARGPNNANADRLSQAGVHVWVRAGAQEVPGLLAGWRQAADGWWGRVVTVTDGQPVETLIRADLLRKT